MTKRHECEKDGFRCYGGKILILEVTYSCDDPDGYGTTETLETEVSFCPFCGYHPC